MFYSRCIELDQAKLIVECSITHWGLYSVFNIFRLLCNFLSYG